MTCECMTTSMCVVLRYICKCLGKCASKKCAYKNYKRKCESSYNFMKDTSIIGEGIFACMYKCKMKILEIRFFP